MAQHLSIRIPWKDNGYSGLICEQPCLNNACLRLKNIVSNSVVKDLSQYDADMGCKAMVNIEPPSVDQRIINQYSFFSVVPSGITCVDDFLERYTKNTVRYIIKKELRWNARYLLDQYNVNERMVYPGLDGLTKWLARHYYVKR